MNNVKQYFSREKFFDKTNIRREEIINRELDHLAGYYGKEYRAVRNLYDTLSHKDVFVGVGMVDNYLNKREQ